MYTIIDCRKEEYATIVYMFERCNDKDALSFVVTSSDTAEEGGKFLPELRNFLHLRQNVVCRYLISSFIPLLFPVIFLRLVHPIAWMLLKLLKCSSILMPILI